MGFCSQFRGFLKRNVKIKYRNKTQTISEVATIVIIMILLILFNVFFKTESFKPIEFEAIKLKNLTLNIFITPNETRTHYLGNSLIQDNPNIKSIQYYNNRSTMENAYLKSHLENIFGIEFLKYPNSYTIYTKWDDQLFEDDTVISNSNDDNYCRMKNDFRLYELCAGNLLVYNGFSYVQFILNKAIFKVRFWFFKE